jgi:regulator of RNase E activity RraA
VGTETSNLRILVERSEMFELTPQLLAELQKTDTPTVCNALEVLVPERRGYGYTTEPLLCIRPELAPVVAIARTATIRSAHPSDLSGAEAGQFSDSYYSYIYDGPKPSVVVIQDIDECQGYGSLWGEVNSAVHAGLGCIGLVTDGAIRDIPDIAAGFQMLAGRVVPSHAFVHIVDFGRPVNVAGMRVRDGDLIHADRHGAVVIPHNVAGDVRSAAEGIISRERVIIEAARQPDFNLEKLREAFYPSR